jgi:phosphoribosyl 1,2-cyclic phosphodiesterase
VKIVVLGSGSKGNSTFIDFGNKKILIDVGFSYKQIKEKLALINIDPHEITDLLITHDHNDHTYGLKVFLNKIKPTLYITEEVEELILKEKYDKSVYITDEMYIDEIFLKIIPTSHDSITSNGFLLEYKQESIVYITDTGYINHRNFIYLKNKTYYIIESNHDTEKLINGPYPEYLQRRILSDKGHLSNELCGGYLSRLIGPNTKKIILAHLSESNNTEEIALETVTKILTENGLNFENITCAKQRELTEV